MYSNTHINADLGNHIPKCNINIDYWPKNSNDNDSAHHAALSLNVEMAVAAVVPPRERLDLRVGKCLYKEDYQKVGSRISTE